jgi:hypothetical protein
MKGQGMRNDPRRDKLVVKYTNAGKDVPDQALSYDVISTDHSLNCRDSYGLKYERISAPTIKAFMCPANPHGSQIS